MNDKLDESSLITDSGRHPEEVDETEDLTDEDLEKELAEAADEEVDAEPELTDAELDELLAEASEADDEAELTDDDLAAEMLSPELVDDDEALLETEEPTEVSIAERIDDQELLEVEAEGEAEIEVDVTVEDADLVDADLVDADLVDADLVADDVEPDAEIIEQVEQGDSVDADVLVPWDEFYEPFSDEELDHLREIFIEALETDAALDNEFQSLTEVPEFDGYTEQVNSEMVEMQKSMSHWRTAHEALVEYEAADETILELRRQNAEKDQMLAQADQEVARADQMLADERVARAELDAHFNQLVDAFEKMISDGDGNFRGVAKAAAIGFAIGLLSPPHGPVVHAITNAAIQFGKNVGTVTLDKGLAKAEIRSAHDRQS